MAEWLKAHAWKACLGETLTWVRIPLSPPSNPRSFGPPRIPPQPGQPVFCKICSGRPTRSHHGERYQRGIARRYPVGKWPRCLHLFPVEGPCGSCGQEPRWSGDCGRAVHLPQAGCATGNKWKTKSTSDGRPGRRAAHEYSAGACSGSSGRSRRRLERV
jgi:hypothetical protein